MNGQCCRGGPPARGPARKVSRAAASIVPGLLLVFLPKCPLCLAAWLTMVTGVGFTAAGAAWVRGMVVVLWVAAMALTTLIVRRRAPGAVRRTE